MVKTELTTRRGMKIFIEGSAKEVAELLDDIERRDRMLEERIEYLKNMDKNRTDFLRNMISHKQEIKLIDILEGLIKNNFFDNGKAIKEIMIELQKQGISAPSTTIHPLLARLIMKGRLKREKGEIGIWEYKRVKDGKN